ncbi:MAG: glycosyltransferase family 2 protein [Chloroflexi bacterium]|nr:glycosyltransferase family 2 protein [Chloroflexota bacterium]
MTAPAKSKVDAGVLADQINSSLPPVPWVSVIIPTYDRVVMLRRAIASVLGQTFRDFELIVVDNGSRDGTEKMVRNIPDPRVRLVRRPRPEGPARARNAGIAVARGEWVAFLDNDDEWLPEKLERQMARMEQESDPKTAIIYCALYPEEAGGERRLSAEVALPEGDLTDILLRQDVIMTPTVYVVKRSALTEIGGFAPAADSAEDVDCWMRLACRGYRFVAVQEPLVVYHFHRDQITKNAVHILRSDRVLEGRWATLREQRLGAAYCEHRLRNRARRRQRRQKKYIKRMVRAGDRRAALRYMRDMVPFLPWGTRYVAQALAFAIFGQTSYSTIARLPLRRGES